MLVTPNRNPLNPPEGGRSGLRAHQRSAAGASLFFARRLMTLRNPLNPPEGGRSGLRAHQRFVASASLFSARRLMTPGDLAHYGHCGYIWCLGEWWRDGATGVIRKVLVIRLL